FRRVLFRSLTSEYGGSDAKLARHLLRMCRPDPGHRDRETEDRACRPGLPRPAGGISVAPPRRSHRLSRYLVRKQEDGIDRRGRTGERSVAVCQHLRQSVDDGIAIVIALVAGAVRAAVRLPLHGRIQATLCE